MESDSLRELFLIRHAKTNWDETDENGQHPLSQKGKKQAYRLGEWMKSKNILPDAVFMSSDIRAIQTFRRLKLNSSSTYSEKNSSLVEASIFDLVHFLASIPEQYKKVAVIAHDPGLEDLVEYLESGEQCTNKDSCLFPAASLAHFVMPHSWQSLPQNSAKLLQLIRPKDMLKETLNN